jgi:hypothetical protein
MEYRRLTLDEFQQLEPEFKRFLATHHLQPEDWEHLKKHDPDRVAQLLDQFSDIVFDEVLGKVTCLEQRKPRELTVFYFAADQLQMAGLQVKSTDPAIDLTNPDVVAKLAEDASTLLQDGEVEVFTTEKPYVRTRKQELLQFWEAGCHVSREALFQALQQLKAGSASS